MFQRSDRLLVLVDGLDLEESAIDLGFHVDPIAFRILFASAARLVRVVWAATRGRDAAAVAPEIDDAISVIHARRPGVVLVVEAMALAPRIDHVVLCASSSDYVPLVAALGRRGIPVTLVSPRRAATSAASSRLRRAASHFIELADLQSKVSLSPAPFEGLRPTSADVEKAVMTRRGARLAGRRLGSDVERRPSSSGP